MNRHVKPRRKNRRARRRAVASGSIGGVGVEARVLDRSQAGLGLETRHGLRVGHRYRFELRSGGRSEAVEGTVRWCRLCRTARQSDGDVVPIYRAGIVTSA